MKKPILAIFMGSILLSTPCIPAASENYSDYPKAAAQYLFSAEGVKDIAAAYGIMMLVTIAHELSHAMVASATCGVPFDVVIGGKRREGSRLKFWGIELAGFNPLQSSSRWEERHMGDEKHYKPSFAQDTTMLVAGPLGQALTGYCVYQYLKNSDNTHYFAKAAALGAIFDTIFGINGLYGACCVPWSDPFKIVGNFKNHFGKKKSDN